MNTVNAVQMNTAAIKQSLEYDEEFFIHFFLGDELTFPVPKFHKDIFHTMTNATIKKFCCAVPRDHAKTTLAKLAVVYHFLFSPYRFIVYISNTFAIAAPACEDIVAFIESENFQAVFGSIEWLTRRPGDGIYKFKIGSKVCILRALGAGQQVRGINVDNQRPQLAVIDDLEDNDNIATEALFLKLKKWVYGPFRKCLDKFDNKMIWLGNMISNRCMLKENCESDFWYSMRYGALLSTGEALWPDAWPLDKLKADFAEYVQAGMSEVWFAEMMNLPLVGGRGLIRPDEIEYRPKVFPGDLEYGFITIDPAISDKTWAHKTAVVVHGFIDEKWQVVDYTFDTGIDPIRLFNITIELASMWGIHVVGIESVAYQASLQPVFAYFAAEQGMEFMEFVKVPAVMQKTQRIAGWCAMLKAKQYTLTEGEYAATDQLLNYDPSKRENDDDLIDACAHGPHMIERHMHTIQNIVSQNSPGVKQSLYDVAAI